jgi:PKD repeat protein
LHSRPGSKRTVHLDFDGATLVNTAWNTSSTPSITALPFDLDGVPYSFSTAELQRIQLIWQRVAEDFAPFDVDVTTEVPSSDALSRSSSGDDTFGTTVLITKRTFYNCSCGGVAYLGVFDDTRDFYKPALVFYDALGGGNEKYVAEAASHEAGHNMGLHHDGTSSQGYYTGHGSGATGWAPIMGVGYYKELVQWSKGEYTGANNKEDDYAVMAANGLAPRADDHGNSIAAATPLAATTANGTSTLDGSGFIERPADVDAFYFVAAPGTFSIAVSPAKRSPDLDIRAELLDATGAVLASANPVDALNSTLSYTSTSGGTFYVAVRGTGKGDLSTGYPSYGSLGEFAIAGTVPASNSQPPVAVLSATPTAGTAPLAASFSSAGSYDPDGALASIEWNFGDGSAPVLAASASNTYSSPGSFTATLKVTDNAGLTSQRTVTITVNSTVATVPISVAGITMRLKTFGKDNAEAQADVSVRDGNGNIIPGATVSGTWSGVVSGSASAQTGSNGIATLKSPRTKSKGTFTLTVTGVNLPGYQYVPASNVETSDSVTR